MNGSKARIKPQWFYENAEGKTKLNWFTYEVALEFQSFLYRSPMLRSFLAAKGGASIARFCEQYALRMKWIISDYLAGNEPNAISDEEFFADYYPGLTPKQMRHLAKAADEAWDSHLSVCEVCPTRCLSEKELPSDLFDSWKDFS